MITDDQLRTLMLSPIVRIGKRKSMTVRMLIECTSGAMATRFKNVGKISKMYHIVADTGEHYVVPMPPLDDPDLLAKLARMLMQHLNAVAYVHMDEAWTLPKDKLPQTREEADKIFSAGISEHPDRVEIVVFTAEDQTGLTMAHRDIIRPQRGKAKLGPLIFDTDDGSTMSGGAWEGRLVGMLPQRGTKQ
jgi:hypothetical protein